jgi:hypothetical protein
MENYVGWGNTICLASEYDVRGVIPLLMVCFHQLNLIVQECNIDGPNEELNEEDTNIFGDGVFIEKSSRAFVTRELSLFRRFPTLQAACNDLLAWWHINEGQFPNVAFLAKQILGIPRSQIETKKCLVLLGC